MSYIYGAASKREMTTPLSARLLIPLLVLSLAALASPGWVAAQPVTGAVEGRISEQGSGEPVGEALVRIYDEQGVLVQTAQADLDGFYQSGHLEDGTYFLHTEVGFGRPWIDQLFGGDDCVSHVPCDVTAGTPIIIANGNSVTGIDLSLPVGGSISGTVFNGVSPGLAAIAVHTADGTRLGDVVTDLVDGS